LPASAARTPTVRSMAAGTPATFRSADASSASTATPSYVWPGWRPSSGVPQSGRVRAGGRVPISRPPMCSESGSHFEAATGQPGEFFSAVGDFGELRLPADGEIHAPKSPILPGSGNGDAARFNRLPRPARRQEWSGQAELAPRPESLPTTETNAGPELSRVADLNPALVGGMP
jgi:hypothetical protein